jgi:regulator of cell morphogenesis and NO signaling
MASLKLNPQVQVATVVAEYPATLKMFEALGIDYCCGGRRLLTEAATQAGMPVETLISVLQTTIDQAASAPAVARDWQQMPLDELMDHIVQEYHTRLARELPLLDEMMAKVARAHGAQHGELLQPLSDTFTHLHAELDAHMRKEEDVTFPAVRHLISGVCDEAVRRTIAELEHEHTVAGDALARLREITHNYMLPADACATYAGLYERLQALERDLHAHIHLENNILFPRAMRLVASYDQAA